MLCRANIHAAFLLHLCSFAEQFDVETGSLHVENGNEDKIQCRMLGTVDQAEENGNANLTNNKSP